MALFLLRFQKFVLILKELIGFVRKRFLTLRLSWRPASANLLDAGAIRTLSAGNWEARELKPCGAKPGNAIPIDIMTQPRTFYKSINITTVHQLIDKSLALGNQLIQRPAAGRRPLALHVVAIGGVDKLQ